MASVDKKCNKIQRFLNKSVNRCLPNITFRPAEKEGWSTIQVCAAGKGLLGPWGWMAVVMRKQVHGQSERLAATLPHSLQQGQTTRRFGTCKNCLEGKATCLRMLVGLSLFCSPYPFCGAIGLYLQYTASTFNRLHWPWKKVCNLFSLFLPLKSNVFARINNKGWNYQTRELYVQHLDGTW